MEWPTLLTLQLPNTQHVTKQHARQIVQSFSRLRRRNVWKDSVKGGEWSLDLSNSGSGTGWHLHLHAVIDAEWLPLQELQAAWQSVTKTNGKIHIKRIRPGDERHTRGYLRKRPRVTALKVSPAEKLHFYGIMKMRGVKGAFGQEYKRKPEKTARTK